MMNKQEWRGRPHRRKPPGFSRRWLLLVIIAGVLILAGLIMMISHLVQGSVARQTVQELREIYEETMDDSAATDDSAAFTPTPSPMGSAAESPAEEATASPFTSITPTPSPVLRLEDVPYPENPERIISARFRELQRENRDIIGWLTIGKIVDEPVVQRDNIFYMDHDVKGKENINGAIFLDEYVSLKTRPWGMILYGHNMRDGGMFGRLRNYESSSFYRSNAKIHFNTAYEDGEYVIFAAGIVDVENKASERYLDIFGVMGRNINERERAIETLKKATPYDCGVEVRLEDQLLLLMTCDGNNSERRVVAARRVRNEE